MASSAFQPASIYAVLFSRGDGTFHWAICVPLNDTQTVKMHASNLLGGWRYEKTVHKIVEMPNACVAVKIGELSSTADIDKVSSLLEKIPMETPAVDESIEPKFSCRVWFKEAIRVLASNHIIFCPDVIELECELRAYGEEQDPKTITGAPVVIYKSSMAKSPGL